MNEHDDYGALGTVPSCSVDSAGEVRCPVMLDPLIPSSPEVELPKPTGVEASLPSAAGWPLNYEGIRSTKL
jgi:hypothetical protein